MTAMNKKMGVALAIAAAALLSTGCTSLCGDAGTESAPCHTHDSCKGSSSCKMPSNSCKGKKHHHH